MDKMRRTSGTPLWRWQRQLFIMAVVAITPLWSVSAIFAASVDESNSSTLMATVSATDDRLKSLQRPQPTATLSASFSADTTVRPSPPSSSRKGVASNHQRPTPTSLYDVISPSSTTTLYSVIVEEQGTTNYVFANVDDLTASRTLNFHPSGHATISSTPRLMSLAPSPTNRPNWSDEDREDDQDQDQDDSTKHLVFDPSWTEASPSMSMPLTTKTLLRSVHLPPEVRSLFVSRPMPTSSSSFSMPASISSSSSSRIYVRSSSQQKHERKQPGFQDIISGLVKLLGGKNVRVANGHLASMANLTVDSDGVLLLGSRLNHRAPPKIHLAEPISQLPANSRLATTPSLTTVAPSVTKSRPSASYSSLKSWTIAPSTKTTTETRRTSPEIRPTSTATLHVPHSTSGSGSLGHLLDQSQKIKTKNPSSGIQSSLSTSLDRPSTSTTMISSYSESKPAPDAAPSSTSASDGVPSGPVTEWLPAHGVAIGFQLKNGHLTPSSSITTAATTSTSTSTKMTSTSSSTTMMTTTTRSSETSTSSTDKKAPNKDQLPTEISYAEYTPPSKTTSSSSSSTITHDVRRPMEQESSLSLHPTRTMPPTNLAPSRPNIVPLSSSSGRPLPSESGATVVTMATDGTAADGGQPDSGPGLPGLADVVIDHHPPQSLPPPTRAPTGSPFVIPVDIQKIRLGHGEATPAGVLTDHHHHHHHQATQLQEQSVFIDGRKTYFNLMPTETAIGSDSTLVNVGIGYTFPTQDGQDSAAAAAGADGHGNQLRQPSQGTVSNVRLNQPPTSNNDPTVAGDQNRAPPESGTGMATHPVRTRTDNKTPIRIDTCIIGDETACNGELNETCRVESGISSCYCRLGYGRDGLEQGCKPIVSLTVYIKVDRVNHEQISFSPDYQNPDSERYQILEYEARNAVESVFSLSALAETFVGSVVNSFFSVNGRVIINATVQLLESTQTRSPTIKQEIRRGLIAVIQQQQQQNIGQSHLYVNGPLNPIPGVQDLDECADSRLNDCAKQATCKNSFGSFKCFCRDGFLDKYQEDQRRSGRVCTVCSTQHCNNRGDCVVTDGKKECKCHGNYIGSQCETDGEVLGVALGASLAALLIIVLTLVCLCMWSRRWKRDQQMLGHHTGTLNNHYSYFNKPSAQTANFHLPMDDRIAGWPPTSDQMDNFYAQPEPITSGAIRVYPPSTRPPSQPPPPPPPATPHPSAPSAPLNMAQQQSQQGTLPSSHVLTSGGGGNSTAHRAVQHLRSLPLSLTSSRSNILDDTDEIDEQNDTSATKFYFPRPKSRINNAVNTSNIYYDVTFANGRDQYACAYDKDSYGTVSGNAFPMKIIRPYHS